MREALFHLRKMGLVEFRSGERARVTMPTPQFVIERCRGPPGTCSQRPGGVQNFQDACAFLRGGLARHAARHATEEDIADFEAALEANRESLGDLGVSSGPTSTSTIVLAVIPRNPIFTAIHAAFAEWLLEQRQTTLAPGEDVIAYEAHKAIFEAVAARDADRAERAMREHLEYVARRYTNVVRGAGMSGYRRHRRFPSEAGSSAASAG